MSLLNDVRMGRGKEVIDEVLSGERISRELLVDRFLKGEIVIVKNRNRKNIKPLAIGKGLKTKINANIGSSRLKKVLLQRRQVQMQLWTFLQGET